MLAPLPEVHAPRDPVPDLLGFADAQPLRENEVGEDKGYFGDTAPVENPPLLRSQYLRESVPYRSGGRGVPAH